MQNLIKKLQETFDDLAADFTAAGLQPVAHIDFYRGQPNNPEAFEYFAMPALFYDYRLAWQREGKVYNGLLTLELHLLTDATWDTSSISTNRDEGLKKLDYHTLVRYALDDLESENTSKLVRADERPVETAVVNYHVFTYTCNYYDPVAIGRKHRVEAVPEGITLSAGLYQKLP